MQKERRDRKPFRFTRLETRCHIYLQINANMNTSILWEFGIAMENGLFIDYLPIKIY